MQIVIRNLRQRLGPNRANTLFEAMEADPDRYVLDEPNVFADVSPDSTTDGKIQICNRSVGGAASPVRIEMGNFE
jgi:hypothetical protein